jgi:hypothetical protein
MIRADALHDRLRRQDNDFENRRVYMRTLGHREMRSAIVTLVTHAERVWYF